MKIFIAIVLAFIIADVLIVGYVIYRRNRKKIPEKLINEISTAWRKIIRQSDYKHAVMEADKLLDYALTQLGLSGNLGSKLKKSPHIFSHINDVWSAHKVRNNIAHQMNYNIDERLYKKTMLAFKQAFKDLKIF